MASAANRISVSLMCADPCRLQDDLRVMEQEKVDFLHMDVMDNHFVPNLGLSVDWLHQIRKHTSIPFDFHLMVEHPEQLIPRLGVRPNEIIGIHFEAVYRLEETVELVRNAGAKLVLAMNPGTPVRILDDVLPMIDGVNYLTISPGFAGQRILDRAFKKGEQLSQYLSGRGRPDFIYSVDGNMNFDNAAIFRSFGANMFVAGTSSVYPGHKLDVAKLRQYRKIISG